MDPLSVSASIAGLLAVAAAVTGMLNTAVRASKFAESVLFEVADIRICLHQLQSFIDGTKVASQSRKSLIMVEDLVVILTRCVTTFSDLESSVRSLKTDHPESVLHKIRWALKEPSISKLLARLQSSKVSLNTLLSIFTCVSLQDAKDSSNKLHNRMSQILENNSRWASRLSRLELDRDQTADSNDDTCSPGKDSSRNDSTVLDEQNGSLPDTFHSDLQTSRAYSRVAHKISYLSRPWSTGQSLCWSFFSGMSMSDISNISTISLLVTTEEISNGERYAPGNTRENKNIPYSYVKSTERITSKIAEDASISEVQTSPITNEKIADLPTPDAGAEKSMTYEYEYNLAIPMNDPVLEVLQKLLKHLLIDVNWWLYALYVVLPDEKVERCLGHYELPSMISKSYKKQGRKAVFDIRHCGATPGTVDKNFHPWNQAPYLFKIIRELDV